MIELFRTIQVVGLGNLLRLSRARRLGWEGILSGFYTTRTMQALFNVGFFDEIQAKDKVNVATFAAARKLDKRILQSLCDSLFALGILNKEGLNYSLGSQGRLLTEVARGWFDGAYGYEEVFHNLEALLRGEKEYGKNLKRRTEWVAKGSGEVEKWIYFPLAVDILSRWGSNKVLDLGCGEGTFLRYLCQRSDRVAGYGLDLAPEAIALGEEQAKQAGLADRIQFTVADISKMTEAPVSLKDIDAAITFFVLHEILFSGPDAVIRLLSSFRDLFPGVPLIVFEAIRPTPEEMRQHPGMAIQYFLQHDLSNQKPVGRGQWKEIFAKAGWKSVEERYLNFARTSIFTLR